MNAKNAYIVFTDLKGFSKLSEPEIRIFYQDILPELSEIILPYKSNSLVWNTWGDALVAIFEDESAVINLILSYRDFFINYNYDSKNITPLSARIAAHFGRFDIYEDPLLDGRSNALGKNINTSARIEPVTRPNEVYVTKEFKDHIQGAPEFNKLNIGFDELGQIPLAKSFGSHDLFRLRKESEQPKITDRILKQDLSLMLPDIEQCSEDENSQVEFYRNSPSAAMLRQTLNIDSLTSEETFNEHFLIKIAKTCKDFGLYDEALKVIDKVKKQKREVDGINIHLSAYNIDLMKLETNCLTRLGRYEEAANLIYGVWQMGYRDPDTLSMLAAQYKRRAIFDDDNNLLTKDKANPDLLRRSLNLYIEAFRLDIDNYYPAINIAYLYKMLGSIERGKGIKLASFIKSSWKDKQGSDWWMDTTLLECDLIIEDFEDLNHHFKEAIKLHKPNYFEKKAVHTQISLYANFIEKNDVLAEILTMLEA